MSRFAARDGQRRSHSLGPWCRQPHTMSNPSSSLSRKSRDLLREVLQVSVEGHEDLAAGGVEPRLQGCSLPVVTGKFETRSRGSAASSCFMPRGNGHGCRR